MKLPSIEWLRSNTDINHVAFLLTQDVELLPHVFDFYLEELINLSNSKKVCLTAEGKLDAYQYEFNKRQAEKMRLKQCKPLPLDLLSYK